MTLQDVDAARSETVDLYNYAHFSRSQGVGQSGAFKTTLRVGEDAPDFELPTVDGALVRLSRFRGHKHVLLEFGSIT